MLRAAWVGAGHMGLCAVDQHNAIAGAREHRALFRYRQRIYHFFGVPPTPSSRGSAGGGGKPLVLVVQTKRVVTNLARLVKDVNAMLVLVVQTKRVVTNLARLVRDVNAMGTARAELIRWEALSFIEQLRLMCQV